MDWIKRNLYFVIGGLVAVLSLGAAGYYLYSKWQVNNAKMQQLDADYATLQQLNSENPHPGSGKIDNIKAAKAQQEELKGVIDKIRKSFERIPALPDSGTNVTSQEFAAALRKTIDQLQKAATNSSVNLPNDFNFSFSAQKPRVTFAGGSLVPLSIQLGEVKAICDILFGAKINWLDNIRRERVSADDSSGPQTEYLLKKSVTNELAIVSPYEVTFRCFSTELGDVLAGFANSRHGLLVKTINVEPAPEAAPADPFAAPLPVSPGFIPPPVVPPGGDPEGVAAQSAFMRRYGIRGGGRGGPEGVANRGGIPLRMPGTPPPYTPPPPVYGAQPTQTAPGKGGLPTVLDEKLLKVTLAVEVIKLFPEGQRGPAAPPPAVPDPNAPVPVEPVMNPEAPSFPGA